VRFCIRGATMVRGALSDAVGYSWLLFPNLADTDGAISVGLGNTVPYASEFRGSARSCCGAARLCTGARIRVGRTWQPAVSAEGVYTRPVNPRSSDTFGAVFAQRGNNSVALPRRSAARGSVAEARGYTGRLYPWSADLRTYCTRVPWQYIQAYPSSAETQLR
jgi:hypothetical protein